MRHPWQSSAEAGDELAVLETDVMRFVAILGLCLAAIFSLVNSAALESGASAGAGPAAAPPPADAQRIGSARQVESAGQAVALAAGPSSTSAAATTPHLSQPAAPRLPEQAIQQSSVTTEQSGPLAQQQPPDAPGPGGFTLEFASAGALQELLTGKLVVLYAYREDAFLQLDPLAGFGASTAPASYYQMHAETVPADLRAALPASGAGGSVIWGVTLSPGMRERIQQLSASSDGGNLVIGRDGSVHLEAAGKP
jgi:hypothetical protein